MIEPRSCKSYALTAFGVAILLCLGSILAFYLWNTSQTTQKQQEVLQGIETTVANLPKLANFETLQVKTLAFSEESSGGPVCYYGRAVVMVGSRLPAADALNRYVDTLQADGWVVREPQYEQDKVLLRGIREQANIFSREPNLELRRSMNYDQARRQYATILFILLDYMIPSEAAC